MFSIDYHFFSDTMISTKEYNTRKVVMIMKTITTKDTLKNTQTYEVVEKIPAGFFIMKRFEELQKEKGCHIDGIYWNSRKSEIENAINCLECPDDMLEKYLLVVSLKYENIGRAIGTNGNFKHHSHNRLYVFNTARQILA